MNRAAVLLGLVLGLLLAPASSGAFLWFGKAKKTGLLWVPAESFSDWGGLAEALARNKKLSFTAALAPSMASAEARARLQPFVSEGRLEIAFRLDHDPILPLIHDHPAAPRPRDSIELLTAGVAAHRLAWGKVPLGFVPAGGLVHQGLFPLLRSLDLAWVATGGQGTAPPTSHREMPLARCGAVKAAGKDLTASDLDGDGQVAEVLVLDEAGGALEEGAWIRFLLTSSKSKAAARKFDRVADALERREDDAVEGKGPDSTKPWTDWTGSRDAWSRTTEQKVAWKLYGNAARAISESSNARSDPRSVASATAALRSSQAGWIYRDLGGSSKEKREEADRALRRHLVSVYKALRMPAPDSILSSLLHTAINPSRAFDAGGSVACRSGPDWLSCDNPSSVSQEKEDPRYRIAGFRVHWDDEAVTLAFHVGKVNASTAAPHGFDGLALGAYIDFNQVARAGSMKLIEGGFSDSINAEDAWEAAVTVTGWGLGLYRTNPRGDPVLEFRGPASADPASGEIIASVPRAKLRGSPGRWGWVVTAGEPGPGGTLLRGVLGDRMIQRRLAGRAGPDGKTAPGRIPASVRLKAVRAGRGYGE